MSTIFVHRTHQLPIAEVRGRVEHAARRAEQRHKVTWRWRENALEVLPPPGVARGARGRVLVGESAVRVEIDLPLLLRPARSMVEAKLNSGLEKLLK
jgi:putative polyhydroxyalkanoate system protein